MTFQRKNEKKQPSAPLNEVNVMIEGKAWLSALPEAEVLAVQAAQAALQSEGWGRRRVVIDITLSDNAKVRKLNREWRGKDKPTNVLSFPLEEPEMDIPRGRARQLGDIILARKTLILESREQNKPLAHHFVHLIVHGVLHLLGYDHLTDDEADEMEAIEISVLSKMKIPNPYAE